MIYHNLFLLPYNIFAFSFDDDDSWEQDDDFELNEDDEENEDEEEDEYDW